MKLIPTRTILASGERIINAYKVTLTKSAIEKLGWKAGDDLKAKYEKDRIVITKEK